MFKKRKRRLKSQYTIIFVPSLPTKQSRQIRISTKVTSFCMVLLVVGIAGVAGMLYYISHVYETAVATVATLTSEKNELTAENAQLSGAVRTLEETIQQQQLEEEASAQGIIDASIPTGFPLNGAASIEEEVDHATIFLVGESVSVVSAGTGEVIYAGDDEEYGNCIQVQHLEGYISIYRTDESMQVAVGDMVERGTVLYTMEDVGTMAYQIMNDGAYIEPLSMMEIAG